MSAPLPTLEQAQQFAAEPSLLKLLVGHFGCIETDHGHVKCPDGVERHSVFPSRGEPSAESLYLSWEVETHRITSTVSIDGERGEVLLNERQSYTERVDRKGLLDYYGEPRTRLVHHQRLTFNGVPARVVRTDGRNVDEVKAAHEVALKDALTDDATRSGWRQGFNAFSVPEKSSYKAPAKIKLPKAYKAPARKDFAPTGFAPGAWFDWTDERDGVTYHCQVQSAAKVGHVWIAGHADGGEQTLMWAGKLNHPSGYRGARDGSRATSLDVLPADSLQHNFGARVLATVQASEAAADEQLQLVA